jgi:hypothetical protein
LDFVLLLLAALTGGSELSCRHNGCEQIKQKATVKRTHVHQAWVDNLLPSENMKKCEP